MAEHSNIEPQPSLVGELLQRAPEAFGARVKLTTYSLDVNHDSGGPKARGFERILGITLEDIGYLEGAIYTGVLLVPVSEVRDAPYGIKCSVDIPVRGIGAKADRLQTVRTVWQFDEPGAPPRLVTAFPTS
jgi:hypothetical protein